MKTSFQIAEREDFIKKNVQIERNKACFNCRGAAVFI